MSSQTSTSKTLVVATVLCIVCATLVAGVSVLLKDRQIANKILDKKRNILICAGLITKEATALDVGEAFQEIEVRIVDLETGEFKRDFNPYTEKEDKEFKATDYNQKKATKLEHLTIKVKDDKGSQIKKRAKYALVYLVKKDGKVSQIILPILSKGLWSTMYGFLALDIDTTNIKGFAYYQHGETPGLGGEVDNPKWKEQWTQSKKAFDDSWNPAISVIKGKVNSERSGSEHQIDGLSGATITSRGISLSLKYWLGHDGFGLLLENIRKKGVH